MNGFFNTNKVDMVQLEQRLKLLKKEYPNAKVTYFFTDANSDGYVLNAKENGKIIYSSYKK